MSTDVYTALLSLDVKINLTIGHNELFVPLIESCKGNTSLREIFYITL